MNIKPTDSGNVFFLSSVPPPKTLTHPAVILREVPGRLLYIWGTTKLRNLKGEKIQPHEVPAAPNDEVFWVDPHTDGGKSLGITQRTFFSRGSIRTLIPPYHSNNRFIVCGTCLPELFFTLQRIAGITR